MKIKETTEHAPGPWKVGKAFRGVGDNTILPIYYQQPPCECCDRTSGQFLVAHTFRHAVPKGQHIPNARLIAAAPDLLEALLLAVKDANAAYSVIAAANNEMGFGPPVLPMWVQKANAALQKAQ